MKKIIFVLGVLTTSLLSVPMFPQIVNEPVALGLPGDNLNLYAILDVFQKSSTLETFERTINDKDSHINNLDLNNDSAIDYIEVLSNRKGNSFSVVLRVAVNSIEYQDVAVIEGYRNNAGRVIVQIIGDEDLYGKNYIVEPSFSETQNPGYIGNQKVIVRENNIYYGNEWPIIVYLFSPRFSVYISPWYWGFYPSYWSPWNPSYYHVYWGFHSQYYNNNHYRRSAYIRYPVNHSFYINRRQSSPIVRQHRLAGRYKDVYDGRTYRRPVAPEARMIKSIRKHKSPSIQRPQSKTEIPSGTRPPIKQIVPSTPNTQKRPEIPSGSREPNKQVAPSKSRAQSRPEIPSETRQPNRQVAPSEPRQSIRRETPSITRPSSRPSASPSKMPSRSERKIIPDRSN